MKFRVSARGKARFGAKLKPNPNPNPNQILRNKLVKPTVTAADAAATAAAEAAAAAAAAEAAAAIAAAKGAPAPAATEPPKKYEPMHDMELDNLGCVVSDEIHYINDVQRG